VVEWGEGKEKEKKSHGALLTSSGSFLRDGEGAESGTSFGYPSGMDAPLKKTTLLLEKWAGGDRKALEELLVLHMPWIRRELHKRMTPVLRAKAETMDLVQESLFQFLEDAPRFKIENGKVFRALLFVIARNTLRQHYRWWAAQRRRIARERPLPPDTVLHLEDPRQTPLEALERKEREAWIRFGLEFLREGDRRIILLRYYEGRPFAEIGEILGIQANAARMRFHRAQARLGKILGRIRRGEVEELGEEDEGED